MAEAQMRQETVVKKFVRLDLTEDEAEFLVDVLARVGGSPELSRRKHELSLKRVLNGIGVYRTVLQDMTGGIDFSNIDS